MIKGYINSLQSLGATDGPGVRFVVFMQGCNLRCGCCHNPDTWAAGGNEMTAEEIALKAERFREYFGNCGGITVSGGEPLLQAEFVRELFLSCKARGINTCLDTSGSLFNEEISSLLDVTDYCLLDIKYTNERDYKEYAGCELESVLSFLEQLEGKKIPTVLRQVIIPTLNDNEENILSLRELAAAHECVKGVELLPFKKLCSSKYDNLGIPFRFGSLPEPKREAMLKLEALLK